jgi:LAO/AO transport system ATPase
MDDRLWQQFQAGDRRALSRLLSQAARGEHLADINARLGDRPPSSRVVAITGSGGVGKSTLVGKLIDWLRGAGKKVGVLACDPQSPLSGGALLGDRFRMPNRPDDDGVFIRSLAALSGRGAIAEHLPLMVRLLEKFGFDIVLIETVGAGQGDTLVHGVADAVVLLLQPETGDDLQWEKAGVLEVADVIVVHKADMPAAEQVAAQVRSTVDMSPRDTPVLLVSSKTGQGVAELGQAIMQLPARRAAADPRRELLQAMQELLAQRFAEADDPQTRALVERYERGDIGLPEASEQLFERLSEQH